MFTVPISCKAEVIIHFCIVLYSTSQIQRIFTQNLTCVQNRNEYQKH
jgi:hypothetical protein